MFILLVFILLIITMPCAAIADVIYKSVAEDGSVSYSATPPVDVDQTSTIRLAPPPTDERIEAAQQRQEQIIKAGEQMEANRKSRKQMTEEENRLRQERQKQQEKTQKQEVKDDRVYGYPYIPSRYPPKPRPPINRPIRPLR